MKVRDIMTRNPVVCTPESVLPEVAKKMADNDCGAVPVVENELSRKLVGIITDRDIVCRAVAKAGQNPLTLKARDAMSSPAKAVRPEDRLDECCRIMEKHQIRRIPVVDDGGACVGIVSLADVAAHTFRLTAAHVLREVSKPVRETAVAAVY